MRHRIALALVLSTLACSGSAEDAGPSPTPVPPSPVAEEARRADRSPSPGLLPDVAMVVHAGKRAFVVLDARADLPIEGASPRLVDTGAPGLFAAEVAVAPGWAPEAARAVVGRRVHLFGERGAVCEATLGELSLLERMSPDGDAHDRWTGTARDDDDHPVPRPSDKEIAAELWGMAEGSHPLVAPLLQMSGDCRKASTAVLGEGVSLAHAEPAPSGLRSEALLAFRALPEHEQIASDYRTWAPEIGDAPRRPTWDTHAEASPTVEVFSVGGERLTWVSADVNGSCGEFSGQLSALFRRTPAGLAPIRVYSGWAPRLHAIAPSEGGYELHTQEARVGTREGEEVEVVEVRFFGCRC